MKPTDFRNVSYLWDDSVAGQLEAVERLRYRSNLLGSDQRITNTGGGNTSSKIKMKDPLNHRAEPVDNLNLVKSTLPLCRETQTINRKNPRYP